jgi:hypothetical protein
VNVLLADGCPVAVLRPENGQLAHRRMSQQLAMRSDDAREVLALMLAEQEWSFVGWVGQDRRTVLSESEDAIGETLPTDQFLVYPFRDDVPGSRPEPAEFFAGVCESARAAVAGLRAKL